jgi:AraC-like DNA-binding protein
VNQPHDHLALKLVRLKTVEEFPTHTEGLTFVFARGGTGKCVTRTTSQILSPGDILVMNGTPGGRFTARDKNGEFLFWNFSICMESLLPLFSAEEISLLRNITKNYEAAKIYPASSPMASECHRLLAMVPPQFNLDHRGQLVRIASSVLSVEFKEAQTRRNGFGRSDEHVLGVFEKLSSFEIINLSVGELAEKFSCSRRHLNRLFHHHFGISVSALRMEMRLLKAVSLLRDPYAKVISVAEQCGFNHLGLFNTCFKRRFGASPGQWRKNTLKPKTTDTNKTEEHAICPLHSTGLCPQAIPIAAQPPPGPTNSTTSKPAANGRREAEGRRSAMLGIMAASIIS